MDFKQMISLLLLIILGVYIGNMMLHNKIKADSEREAYKKWLEEQQNGAPPATV